MDYYLFASVAGGVLLLSTLFLQHDHDSPLQLRTLTYFLAFGGVAGLLIEHVAHVGALLTAGAALSSKMMPCFHSNAIAGTPA